MKWAVLVPAASRPPILNALHSDWPKLLQRVPRAWTSWIGGPPKKLLGNSVGHLDIPDSGWLVAWPPYFAFTSWGWHGRLGFRYDYEGYFTFPAFTLKRWLS